MALPKKTVRVVIIGGGFGGVRLGLRLANRRSFEVKLISDQNFFEYHAALYRSATGRSPLEVAVPLRYFFSHARNVEVIEDKIVSINPNDRIVTGESESEWRYNVAIIAVGSRTAYYNIKGLKRYSYGIKTIHEALELKRHLHDQLVEGHADHNYVVVGGGASGVELAAELTAYLDKIYRNHMISTPRPRIHLLEAEERILARMPATFSRRVTKHLQKLGVTVRVNTTVQAETYESLKLLGEKIETHTVIWTAGTTNNPLIAQAGIEVKPGRRAMVNSRLEAAERLYVIGDSAGTKYSGMAQTALFDADFVADNLIRLYHHQRQRRYRPKRPIYAIPVGPHWSAVLWGRVAVYGRAGWMLRRLADLRLYLKFLPLGRALTTWRYGVTIDENCPVCSRTH